MYDNKLKDKILKLKSFGEDEDWFGYLLIVYPMMSGLLSKVLSV